MDFSAFIILAGMTLSAAFRTSFPVASPAPSAAAFQAPHCPLSLGSDTSGIQGKVYVLSGNRMPSPPRHPGDTIRRATEGPGVKGTVCVFELTNDSQVTRQGTSLYFVAVHTRSIRQVETDDKGNFTIPLPPGTYSVFTRKGKLFYATRRDQQNNIAPVKVLPGKMTRVDCSVESDQKVVY